ncbi:MAG: hydroxyacid dehydrogenase [Candidatus Pacebacteria bacterium]|nr:hydroxyacid dehydrogenase [Candidatus Paceibacterota bacterium]
MHIVFDVCEAEERALYEAAFPGHQLTFLETSITEETALPADTEALCVFIASKVPEVVMAQLPQLKLIAARSMGYDHIDAKAARARGITVVSVPSYGVRTVAEFTFALILALSRKVYDAYDRLRSEGTTDVKDFEGFDLAGQTIGIVGTGNIGRNVGRIAKGFGMHVMLYDPHHNHAFAQEVGAHYVELEELVMNSGIVSLHVPYLPATHHLVNEALLTKFKPGAYLINTARGGIVDTKALVLALKEGRLGGAGLDVVEGERDLLDETSLLTSENHDVNQFQALVAAHELLHMPNVILTPHIAFNTKNAKREIVDVTVCNVKDFLDGKPQNVVPA